MYIILDLREVQLPELKSKTSFGWILHLMDILIR